MKNKFIAHLRKRDKAPQYLCSHLTKVSVLTGQFAAKIGLNEADRLLGLLHDLGKASARFDNYIKSATGLKDPDEDDYVDARQRRARRFLPCSQVYEK
jgi:CRISPR-associated endonuclease/helicase Cas3